MILPAQVLPGSDEELVYRLVAELQPVTRAAIAASLGITESSATDALSRLRAAGLCYSAKRSRSSWVLGRDPRLGVVSTDRIGVRSAMRRRFQAGGEYTPAQMAVTLGVPVAVAMTEISKMCSSDDVVRAGPLDGQREHVRYKARPKHGSKVVPIFGLEPGSGDRRDDCVNYRWCLDHYHGTEQARCKLACPGYQAVSRENLIDAATVQRRPHWSKTI